MQLTPRMIELFVHGLEALNARGQTLDGSTELLKLRADLKEAFGPKEPVEADPEE